MEALQKVMSYFAEQRDQVFKTITGDNGSEFAELSLLENGQLKVYFIHPYSSCEKGTNEMPQPYATSVHSQGKEYFRLHR